MHWTLTSTPVDCHRQNDSICKGPRDREPVGGHPTKVQSSPKTNPPATDLSGEPQQLQPPLRRHATPPGLCQRPWPRCGGAPGRWRGGQCEGQKTLGSPGVLGGVSSWWERSGNFEEQLCFLNLIQNNVRINDLVRIGFNCSCIYFNHL